MRNYLLAAAAISGLVFATAPSSASPLASGLASVNTTLPALNEGMVQKVHGWHCGRRYGWWKGHKWRHRHLRACDDYDDDYSGGYYPGPSISFGFYDFDNDRHHGGYKYKKKYYKKGGNKGWND